VDASTPGPSVPPRPICAKPLATATQTTRIRLDANGRIDEDVSCRKCGYNLRTLLPDGICPECATAVGRSLQGDFLRFSDPYWVESLASGMNWIVASIVLSFVTGGLGGGAAVCMRWAPSRPDVWFLLPMLAIGLVGIIGYWRVTVPDPSGLGEEGRLNSRKVLRFCQIGGYLFNLIQQAFVHFVPVLVVLGAVAGGILGMVSVFSGFVYARRLALRIPDTRLARSCRIVMWGAASVMVLVTATTIASIMFIRTSAATFVPITTAPTTSTATFSSYEYSVGTTTAPTVGRFGRRRPGTAIATSMPASAMPASFMMAIGFLGCGVSPVALVFGIWAIVIVVRLRKAMNVASIQARTGWASVQAVPVNSSRSAGNAAPR